MAREAVDMGISLSDIRIASRMPWRVAHLGCDLWLLVAHVTRCASVRNGSSRGAVDAPGRSIDRVRAAPDDGRVPITSCATVEVSSQGKNARVEREHLRLTKALFGRPQGEPPQPCPLSTPV